MGRECRTYGREQECIEGLKGKPEEKTLLERTRCKMLDNTENNLGKI
jgi:hypothetical protein